MSSQKTFHVDLFGRLGIIIVVIFLPILWIASESLLTLLVAGAFLMLAEIGTYYFCTVAVSRSGIVLYRTNRADWYDIIKANQVSFLGLPYLRVERKKGVKWWLPLYLAKLDEFWHAVIINAPAGNPLRRIAEQYTSG